MCWKNVFKKLLFPGGWVVLLCAAAAAGGLGYVFVWGRQESWVAYPIYAFSFYALTVLCALLWKDFRHPKEVAGKALDRAPLLRRYFTDKSFGMQVPLYRSLGLNVLYAAMKLGFGIYYRSVWFGTLAVYYFLLAVVRFGLVRYARKTEFGTEPVSEWKHYRSCGVVLLLLNLVLGGEVILVLYRNEGFHYAGYLIYVMAVYAFYCVTMAVRNVIVYRKFHSPIMSAAKALQLAAALVSMLALETAMLEQFGGNDGERFRAIMTGCTGGGVCLAILGMAIYMIQKSNREVKMLEKEKRV